MIYNYIHVQKQSHMIHRTADKTLEMLAPQTFFNSCLCEKIPYISQIRVVTTHLLHMHMCMLLSRTSKEFVAVPSYGESV